MLVSVGDLLEEILVRLDADPVRGGATAVRSLRLRAGSAAGVAAIDAELGGTPRFIGQVGDDPIGHGLVEHLQGRGVDTRVAHGGRTGVVVTMLGRGGRSQMIDRGAARRLPLIDAATVIDATQLYLAATAFTEDPMAGAVDRLLGEIVEHRIPVTLRGPSTVDLESLGPAAFLELCHALAPAHVVLNRDEHEGLGLTPRQPIDGAATTIVTNAARPTLVLTRDDARPVEVPPVDTIVDRTGAGDAFTAGFLASRRTGANAVSAAHAGHRVAARVLGQIGPTTGATP